MHGGIEAERRLWGQGRGANPYRLATDGGNHPVLPLLLAISLVPASWRFFAWLALIKFLSLTLPERPGVDALLPHTNIVSAWARKSSSALMLKLAQAFFILAIGTRGFVRLHPGRARAALRFHAPARDSGGSDDPAPARTPAEPAIRVNYDFAELLARAETSR